MIWKSGSFRRARARRPMRREPSAANWARSPNPSSFARLVAIGRSWWWPAAPTVWTRRAWRFLWGRNRPEPTPGFVRAKTGFAIGGVAPLGHLEPPQVFLDADLLDYDVIWAAAGTPQSVFSITPADLPALTGGAFHALKVVS